MPQFSFVVPVYNTKKYLKKCLDSLLNQTYDDYEIIVVNDGSPDNSQTIIDEYKEKSNKIKNYIKTNGGLSDARNYGVEKAKGEYLIFVDSDDYVDSRMLEKIGNVIKEDGNIDMIKFNFMYVINNVINRETDNVEFKNKDGKEAFVEFIKSKHHFEMACLYAYNRGFWLSNDFHYAKGRVHEDFGLTPLVLIKARSVTVINDCLYYYVQNETGITGDQTKSGIIKKAWDTLYHFDYLYLNVNSDVSIDKKVKKIFNSFIANALINKAVSLSDNDLKKYLKELKSRNVSSLLLGDNIKRLLKKLMVKFNTKVYLNFIAKRR